MSKRKRSLQRKPRATTTVAPYVYVSPATGLVHRGTTLVQHVAPTPRVAPTAPAPFDAERALADVLAECDAEATIRRFKADHRARVSMRVQPAPRGDADKPRVKPREISCDATGYAPTASYSRAELLRELIQAARYA